MNKDKTIVVPQKMSVGELRDWLAQFGENNRVHFENNTVQRGRDHPNDTKQHVQDLGKTICATSSTVSSSSRESLLGTQQLMDEFIEAKEDDEVEEEGKEVTLVEAGAHKKEFNQGNSVFRSLDLPQNDKNGSGQTTRVPSNHDRSPGSFHENEDDDCRIVSINKLLEAPKPVRRQSPATSWEELLQDDFTDPFESIRNPASFVRHLDRSRNREIEVGAFSSSGGMEDTKGRSEIAEGLKKEGYAVEPNVASSKARASSRGSLRSRLPMLLCKTGSNSSDEPKLVQRTFNNGLSNSAFRSLSPSPFPGSADVGDSRSTIEEPASNFDSLLNKVRARTDRYHHEDQESTVSCPDLAAATIYLHQLSVNKDEEKEASDSNAKRARERLSRRERRKYRSTSRLAEEKYGTSAILPGAVDASLGQVFAIEDAETKPNTVMMDYRPPRHAPVATRSSLVSDRISKFGGGRRRPSSVQLRRQELQKQWASNHAVQYVSKTKWQASNPGNYKRKVVVDKEPIE
mmetsp:Transcript_11934/g.33057  ORF Transcript_11934/g.33057 Transcript_11934/m.33057 type:complete len:516 (+) Transcript_11934:449-1996(+)